jgi:hypothetical protein
MVRGSIFPAGDVIKTGNPGVLRNSAFKYPLCLIFFLWLLSFPAVSQNLQQKITLKLTNRSISDVLEEITTLTKINFSFNPGDLPVDKIITVEAKNRSVASILEEVLWPNGIDYLKVESHIVLKPRTSGQAPKTNLTARAPPRFTVSGYLRDKQTGEALIGANVYVKGTTVGSITNGYGFFSITLPVAA